MPSKRGRADSAHPGSRSSQPQSVEAAAASNGSLQSSSKGSKKATTLHEQQQPPVGHGLNADLIPVKDLSKEYQKAVQECLEASKNSYCPYSNFNVGAALLHPDGSITKGTNWENCVYQAVCAERSALVAANVQGKRSVKACAVWGGPKHKPFPPATTLCTPCGVCRQMLNEAASLTGSDIDVILVCFSGKEAKVIKLKDLLPADFGPKDLGMDLLQWADPMSLLHEKNNKKKEEEEGSKRKSTTKTKKK